MKAVIHAGPSHFSSLVILKEFNRFLFPRPGKTKILLSWEQMLLVFAWSHFFIGAVTASWVEGIYNGNNESINHNAAQKINNKMPDNVWNFIS